MRAGTIHLATLCIALSAVSLNADPRSFEHGGDYFRSGSGSGEQLSAARDVFVSGASVAVRGDADGVVHAMGFDVDVESSAQSVYAMGASVEIEAETSRDATAMGASVDLDDDARIGGNARLMGASVTIEGEIDGALFALGGEILLDGPVGGDVRLTAASISFGDDAYVGGLLTYSAPERIDVPLTVAPPERVVYEPLPSMPFERAAEMGWPKGRDFAFSALSVIGGFLVTLAFILVLAAAALAFAPDTVEARRREALNRPGLTLLLGVLGLSVVIGLAPVSGMAIIGLPFLPLVILSLILMWTVGYVLGSYVVALRIWTGLGGAEPSLAGKLAVLALAVTFVALLNFVPVLGWLLNFALVLFGVGALTTWGLSLILEAKGLAAPRSAAPSDDPTP